MKGIVDGITIFPLGDVLLISIFLTNFISQ